MLWCTYAEARIQGIADAGARTLTSLVWRWTPSDAWLDRVIRCMMPSSASKASGILDTSPAAIFTRSASNLTMNSQARRWYASASLARASPGSSQDASEKIWNLREPLGLGGGAMVRAFKRSAWSPSTSLRFSNHSGDSTLVRNTAFAPGTDCSCHVTQRTPINTNRVATTGKRGVASPSLGPPSAIELRRLHSVHLQ